MACAIGVVADIRVVDDAFARQLVAGDAKPDYIQEQRERRLTPLEVRALHAGYFLPAARCRTACRRVRPPRWKRFSRAMASVCALSCARRRRVELLVPVDPDRRRRLERSAGRMRLAGGRGAAGRSARHVSAGSRARTHPPALGRSAAAVQPAAATGRVSKARNCTRKTRNKSEDTE